MTQGIFCNKKNTRDKAEVVSNEDQLQSSCNKLNPQGHGSARK